MFLEAFVTLTAFDSEALINFYRLFLQMEPDPYIPHVYGEFKLAGLRLGIFQPKKMDHLEFANSGGNGMSICVEVADLEAVIAHLDSLGYPPPGEIITADHGREIYAYDPAHNRLILHESSPKPS